MPKEHAGGSPPVAWQRLKVGSWSEESFPVPIEFFPIEQVFTDLDGREPESSAAASSRVILDILQAELRWTLSGRSLRQKQQRRDHLYAIYVTGGNFSDPESGTAVLGRFYAWARGEGRAGGQRTRWHVLYRVFLPEMFNGKTDQQMANIAGLRSKQAFSKEKLSFARHWQYRERNMRSEQACQSMRASYQNRHKTPQLD